MKKFTIDKRLPWPRDALYGLIMDVDAYPSIYPMVKEVTHLKGGGERPKIKIDFNLASGAVIKDPSLVIQITGERPHKIHVVQTSGQFKAMSMDWSLHSMSDNETDLEFSLSYDTGWGAVGDLIAPAIIKRIAGDTLTRFEAHAAKVLKSQDSHEPQLVRHRKRWVPA